MNKSFKVLTLVPIKICPVVEIFIWYSIIDSILQNKKKDV